MQFMTFKTLFVLTSDLTIMRGNFTLGKDPCPSNRTGVPVILLTCTGLMASIQNWVGQ